MHSARGSADVVVVGAGIVGTCTALALRRTGREVTLIERAEPAEEASGYNGGSFWGDCMPVGSPEVIRSLPKMLVDPMSPLAIRWVHVPRLTPWLTRFALASRSSRVEQISAALVSLTSRGVEAYRALMGGTDTEKIFDGRGLLMAYTEPEQFDSGLPYRLRDRHGVPYEVLEPADIATLDPVLAGKFARAAYFPNARWTTDPAKFTRALVAEFTGTGGRLLRAEVSGFSLADGHVGSVRTTVGDVRAGTVVICAGPWSRKLLRKLGTGIPLDVERGYGLDLADPGFTLPCPVILAGNHVALSPHRGGLRLSGRDELAGIATPPDFRLTDNLMRAAIRFFPELSSDGARPWMRRRPSMPDSLPVIGRAPRQDNVYLAFGHGHKGMGTGAITGQLIRELIEGAQPSVDLTPFRPTRFSLRSRPRAVAARSTSAQSVYDIESR